MVGSIVLRECLTSDAVGQVVSFGRRSSGITDPKLTEVILTDFLDLSGQEAHFQEVDTAYFCMGAYTGQVDDDKFRMITVDIPKAFADALKAHSPQTRFCLLSGQGADQTEKSRISFARYKGMIENHLIRLDFGGLHLFRPGYIYPVEQRQEPNFSYRLMRWLYPMINPLFPAISITSEQLGQAIFQAGLRGTNLQVLENEDIKAV